MRDEVHILHASELTPGSAQLRDQVRSYAAVRSVESMSNPLAERHPSFRLLKSLREDWHFARTQREIGWVEVQPNGGVSGRRATTSQIRSGIRTPPRPSRQRAYANCLLSTGHQTEKLPACVAGEDPFTYKPSVLWMTFARSSMNGYRSR